VGQKNELFLIFLPFHISACDSLHNSLTAIALAMVVAFIILTLLQHLAFPFTHPPGLRRRRGGFHLRQQVRDAVQCRFDEGKAPKIIRLHFVRDEVLAG
jgi:hypothetical protein